MGELFEIEQAEIEQALRRCVDKSSLVNELFIGALQWPLIPEACYSLPDDSVRFHIPVPDGSEDKPCLSGQLTGIRLPTSCDWQACLLEFSADTAFDINSATQSCLTEILKSVRKLLRVTEPIQAVDRNVLLVCTTDYQRLTFIGDLGSAVAGDANVPQAGERAMFCCDSDVPSIVSLHLLAWSTSAHTEHCPTRNWWQAFQIGTVASAFVAEAGSALAEMERELAEINSLRGDQLRWFVLSVFSGLMFLRIAECKGWSAVPASGGTLRDVWQRNQDSDESLFSVWIGPLLFGRQWSWSVDCRIESEWTQLFRDGWHPEHNVFDRVPQVPDTTLKTLIGPNGLLYRYAFQIDENHDGTGPVAIGPQVLGQVLEAEMAQRRLAGAFYSPPDVVAFMCREGLKGTLLEKTGLDEAVIQAVVDDRQVDQLPTSVARKIFDGIAALRVVDPACGAGAYLLGYLSEVCRILKGLSSVGQTLDPRSLCEWKQHLVRNCMFGVDLDPVATRITCLRLWLSLAADAEQISDLAEFSVQIETGDALLGAVPDGDEDRMQNELPWAAASDIQQATCASWDRADEASRGASSLPEASVKRGEHEAVDWSGWGIVPSVDWGRCFPRVFEQANPGFDIVLANPPYVRKELIPRTVRPLLKQRYAAAITGQSDLYCCFYVRGLEILRQRGLQVFLCSNSWLDARYGGKLQKYLLANSQIEALYESANQREFAAADINTVVSVVRKSTAAKHDRTRFVLLADGFDAAHKAQRREIQIRQDTLWEAGRRPGGQTDEYVHNKWGGKYLRAPKIYLEISQQSRLSLKPLGTLAEITGYIHDNNTGTGFPERPFLKSVKRTQHIRIRPDSVGVQRRGVKSVGLSDRTAPILFPRTLGARHLVIWNPQRVYGKEFYKITPVDPRQTLSLIIQLNSAWAMLQRELLGLTNLGDGALKFSIYDLQLFEIVSDLDVSACAQAWESLSQRAQLAPEQELWQSDRMDVDRVVFDALHLDTSQAEQVRAAVCELVERRLTKPRTARVKLKQSISDTVRQ